MEQLLNGEPASADDLNQATRRAWQYGDGLFETMRWGQGCLAWAALHAARLARGAEALGLALPPALAQETLAQSMQKSLLALGLAPEGSYRLRLSLMRTGQGSYTPQAEGTAWLLQAQPLADLAYPLQGPVRVGVLPQWARQPSSISPYKTLSTLPYVLAAKEAAAQGWDDALLPGPDGLAESTRACLLWVPGGGGAAVVPPPSEGGVAGVLRAALLLHGLAPGLPVVEGRVTLDEVRAGAGSLFLTNAIQGLVPVGTLVLESGELALPVPPAYPAWVAQLNETAFFVPF